MATDDTCQYLTQAEFEKEMYKRHMQEGAALAREMEQREILNEIRADLKDVVQWKNKMSGALDDYVEIRRWVQNAQGGLLWGTAILIFLLGILGWALNHFFFGPVMRHMAFSQKY